MLRNILAGTATLVLVIAFAASASANPQNRFGDNNTAAVTVMGDANAHVGAIEPGDGGGIAGAGGAGGTAIPYAESFNSDIEVISVQEMTVTVNGTPILVFGGTGGAGGIGAPSDAGNGGALSAGATTVAAGAGAFGGIANMNVASGYFNSALGGVSAAGTGLSSQN
mgnify:CR=1 FL=1